MSIFIGIDGKANEINSIFIGDNNNKAQQISDLYYGVNNKALQILLSNSILPREYQQVEYISSTRNGKQYINSLLLGNSPLYFEVEFEINYIPTGTASSNYTVLIGSQTSSSNTPCIPILFYPVDNSTCTIRYVYRSGFTNTSVNGILNKKYHASVLFSKDQQQAIINDTIKTGTVSYEVTSNKNLFIFCDNSSDSAVKFSAAKLYLLKIYSSSNKNEIYRDFYPCYRKSDNKTGLYDLVTKNFYPDQSNNEFEIGEKCDKELIF